ncbi:hypothetical protein [Bremerella cremea]|nr:hypothetical protein [Bremerella cremea]
MKHSMAKKRKRTEYFREYRRKNRERLLAQKAAKRRDARLWQAKRTGDHCLYVGRQGLAWGRSEAVPEGAQILLSGLPWLDAQAIVVHVAGKRGRAVERVSPDGSKIQFVSIKSAEKETGIGRGTIGRRLRDGRVDNQGCIWRGAPPHPNDI